MWSFKDAAEYAANNQWTGHGVDAFFVKLDERCGFKWYGRQMIALLLAARQKYVYAFADMAPKFGEFGEFKRCGSTCWGYVTELAPSFTSRGKYEIPKDFLHKTNNLLKDFGLVGRPNPNADDMFSTYPYDLHSGNIGTRVSDGKDVPIDFGFTDASWDFRDSSLRDTDVYRRLQEQHALSVEEFLGWEC